MINDLADFLARNGFTPVVQGKSSLRVYDSELPVYLEARLEDNKVYTYIGFTGELREELEEAALSGEDIEEMVENSLSYLNTCALLVKKWADEKRLITVFKLREGSVELMELLEDIMEELKE